MGAAMHGRAWFGWLLVGASESLRGTGGGRVCRGFSHNGSRKACRCYFRLEHEEKLIDDRDSQGLRYLLWGEPGWVLWVWVLDVGFGFGAWIWGRAPGRVPRRVGGAGAGKAARVRR